jgi:photosystem II stability/assembly factor-like uncharacterized protein
VNDALVLAAGYWGSIYRSEDGGQTWAKADTGTKRLIYDIAMADDLHGWAVGQLGLVLRTDDGGKTWKPQHTPKDDQGVHLFSVEAVGQSQALIVGEWGTRLITTDGGQTWRDDSLTLSEDHPQFVWLTTADQEKVRRGEKVFEDVGLNDVHCLPGNRKKCWIIGEFAYLFRSDDGGETWERGDIVTGFTIAPIRMSYNEITLTDADREHITEFAHQITDMQHLNIAIEPRVSAAEIAAFGKESDPFPLFEIIEARTQEVQTVIEDAGILSDRIRRRGAPPWDFEDFVEKDPDFLKRYLNGRRAATPGVEVTVAQNPYLFSVRFADENEGYISGLGGVVLRSHDGGRTWNYEDVGRKVAAFSIAALGKDTSIVVGEKGFISASTDGGKTWEPWKGFPVKFTFMRDIGFAPGNQVGYIVGQSGMVLRTADGGQSWNEVLSRDILKAREAPAES